MRLFASVLMIVGVLIPAFLSAQEISSTKLDLLSKRTINAPGYKYNDINLLVKGDADEVAALAKDAGGFAKYSYVGITAVNIPLSTLDDFLANDAIGQVQNLDVPVTLMNDTAIYNNRVDLVQSGTAPLMSAYQGDGVLIGMIDDGIDLEHEDFQKPNGDTRVRFIWDQLISGTSGPQPYGYGYEWTELDINAGTCTHAEAVSAFSHGTHVTGIAAGNGRATGQFKGMAPEADIIAVAFNYNRPFLSSVLDGVDYIFKKADAMGMPCVINGSLGTYIGSHDGTDLNAQLIDALLDERGGRAMVVAAGNGGRHKYHLGYDVTSDTTFTWFRFNNTAGDVFFQLWADTADFNDVYFSFGADDPASNWDSVTTLSFLNVKTDYAGINGAGGSLIKNYTLTDNGGFVASVSTQLTLENGKYLLEVLISPQNNAFLWRFITTGSGKFDIWSSRSLMNFSDMVYDGLPDPSEVPSIVYYREPDTLSTITSSYNCSDHVISVGNYNNRGMYVDYYDDTLYSPFVLGGIYPDDEPVRENNLGSSIGPTRDGRIKPDLAAPGGWVISSGNARYISDAIGSGNPDNYEKVAQDGRHFRSNGTSQASPMVAGAVALYLQKNPNAYWYEVKDAIISSAFQDQFTGTQPNVVFGHGKLNAFAALQVERVFGCTDSTAMNYDPLAEVDNGSCIAAVIGCMDPLAINYNSDANVDDGSCFYDSIPVGLNDPFSEVRFVVAPNPSNGQFRVFYELPENTQATMDVVNMLGQLVEQRELNNTTGTLLFDGYRSGMYIYRLRTDAGPIWEGKLTVK